MPKNRLLLFFALTLGLAHAHKLFPARKKSRCRIVLSEVPSDSEKERAIRILFYLERAGYRPDPHNLFSRCSLTCRSDILSSIQRDLGIAITFDEMEALIERYWETYAAAAKELGIREQEHDTRAQSSGPLYENRATLLLALKTLRRRRAVTFEWLSSKNPAIQQGITYIMQGVQIEANGPEILRAAFYHFGGLERALKEISPEGPPPKKANIAWTRELYKAALLHLEAEGFGPVLTPKLMLHASAECKADIELALKEGLGLDTSVEAFAGSLPRFYKDPWVALKEENVPVIIPPRRVGTIVLNTREAVIKALQALAKSDYPLTPSYLNSTLRRSPLNKARVAMTALIAEASGISATARDVYASAVHQFGSLDRALRAADLPELAVVALSDRVSPLEQKLISAFQLLKEHEKELAPLGLDFHYKTFRYLPPELRAAIEKLLNEADDDIHLAPEHLVTLLAQTRFKTVDQILRAAGLDAEARASAKRFIWTKETALEAIDLLQNHGVPLSDVFMKDNLNPEISEILCEYFGRAGLTPSNLRQAAIKYMGTWEAAVGEAGFDYDTVRRETGRKFRYAESASAWTEERIIRAFQLLYEHGIPVDANSLKLDESEATAQILTSVTGRKATGGPALHKHVFRIFGGWEFLPQIPCPREAIPDIMRALTFQKRIAPKLNDIEVLNYLAEENVDLDPLSLRKNKTAVELIKKRFRVDDVDMEEFIHSIAARYGTFNEGLKKTGLATNVGWEDPSLEEINEWTIYLYNEFLIYPTAAELVQQSSNIKTILRVRFKSNFSGYQLMRRLRKEYRYLYYASEKLGLPVEGIHQRIPEVKKKIADLAADTPKVKQYGVDDVPHVDLVDQSPRPDQAEAAQKTAQATQETTKRLETAMQELPEGERLIAETLLSYLDEHANFADRAALETYFEEQEQEAPDDAKIAEVFAELKKNMENRED